MYSIASLLRFIVFLMPVFLLSACSDTASQTSNPDAADNNVPVTPPIVAQPLLAPQDLAVSTENGVVTLDWSEVSTDNTNSTPTYDIYWNITGNVTLSDTKVENVTSPHVVEGLTVGETYYFIITTVTIDEESDMSFEIFAKAPIPVLVSIDLQPADSSNISGSTVQFIATGVFSDGTLIDITSAVSWSSVDPRLADIDDVTIKGLLSAANIGTTTIIAQDPISDTNGSTSFRTQINHGITGSQQFLCNSSGCHSISEFSQNHPNSSDNCSACHITIEPFTWKPFAAVDHNEVLGSCAACHDGSIFIGKSVDHINSSDMCNDCHAPDTDPLTPEWIVSVAVDHAQIGVCIDCHNGAVSRGKDITHFKTTDNCAACHTTFQFKPILKVDHNDVIGECISCHDGINAKGKGGLHIETTDNCAVCHTILQFKPVLKVDHNDVIGACVSCHDGVIAKGKGGLHITSGDVCEDCHVVTGWFN